MLAGILITLGMGTIAYVGIASATAKTAVEASNPRTMQQAHDVRSLPFVGTIVLLGGMALLVAEWTRPLPLFDRWPRGERGQ